VLIISFNMPALLMNITGGTGLIIVVGVVLQTVQQLEAKLLTHNYEGLRVRRRRRGEVTTEAGSQRRGLLGGAN
jgi:preprotein translocase subunit SecY